MISLTAAETATAWATLDGVALQTSDTSADCFKLIVGSTIHKGSAAGYGSAPTVDCSLVQSRLRGDEARRALDESVDLLTKEQEAVRNTKTMADGGR